MIKSAEIRKTVSQALGNYLVPFGYTPVKVKGELLATFTKKSGNFDFSFYSTLSYYNGYQIVYGFSFGIDEIVKILKHIDQTVPLSRSKYEIRTTITGLSPGQLLDPFDVGKAYKYFKSESELLNILEEIKSFYEKQFIPFCEKYSRFEELDKLVNSSSNFWEDSHGKTIPIDFFHVTRLIIARLANNPDYDNVVEKNFQALERLWKRYGGVYDRNDAAKPEVFAAKFLINKTI